MNGKKDARAIPKVGKATRVFAQKNRIIPNKKGDENSVFCSKTGFSSPLMLARIDIQEFALYVNRFLKKNFRIFYKERKPRF